MTTNTQPQDVNDAINDLEEQEKKIEDSKTAINTAMKDLKAGNIALGKEIEKAESAHNTGVNEVLIATLQDIASSKE